MIEKFALFHSEHLHYGGSEGLSKVASSVLPAVADYIAALKPAANSQYVLVNAMGASEYYGSNSNGDWWPEKALTHAPHDWMGTPVIDIPRSKEWPYGYPTFYYAKPFGHHKNNDPARGFGAVELAAWNDPMKRVELVLRLDEDKCMRFGGESFWKRLRNGEHPDVSMGARVPFDTCVICLDHERYDAALRTYDPKRHKHPGEAVLEIHKKDPITGVSPTRATYCVHARNMMNKILPDGRKVYVINDFPRFFDISFVGTGADKTAKVMLKIAEDTKTGLYLPEGLRNRVVVAVPAGFSKTASAERAPVTMVRKQATRSAAMTDEEQKTAELEARHADLRSAALDQMFGKHAVRRKQSEIDKRVPAPELAVPILASGEKDIPKDVLDNMSKKLPDALATTNSMGIVLRPREFQRVMLVRAGAPDLADSLERQNITFGASPEEDRSMFGGGSFASDIARALLPLLGDRSCFSPVIEKRVIVVMCGGGQDRPRASSLSSPTLSKIAATYNGYRAIFMEHLHRADELLIDSGFGQKLAALAHESSDRFVSRYTEVYAKTAFLSECGRASVQRGLPSNTTR